MIDLGNIVVAETDIRTIDLTHLENLRITVHLADGGSVIVRDAKAVDVMMRLSPAVFEGRRLRFARHAWAVHNLIGHPLLQVLSWLGFTKLGLRVHDRTTPRPRVR